MQPDFIIVGAMKAATTSVCNYLHHHPEVDMPYEEPHIFDSPTFDPSNFEYYNNFFKLKNRKVKGEKTPTYSFHPQVPERIYNFNPDCKIIWILREPVARAYSNYWHAVKNGIEYLSFEQAWKQESLRIEKNIFYGYFERSIYINQINRYLQFFPLSQMHIVLQEELQDENAIKNICKFLGIENKPFAQNQKRKNITTIPHSRYLQYYGKKFFNNTKVYSLIWHLNKRSKPGYPAMSSKIKSELQQYFLPYNIELASLINKDLSHW